MVYTSALSGCHRRNGLEGFGREDEENYAEYEYCKLGNNTGGTIVHNEGAWESGGDSRVEVTLSKLDVDPQMR